MSDDQLTLFGRPIDRRTLLTLTGKVLAGSAVAGLWLSPELAQFVDAAARGRASGSITVMKQFSPNLAKWKSYMALFTKETGIKVNLDDQNYNNQYQKITTQGQSGAHGDDVVEIDTIWTGSFGTPQEVYAHPANVFVAGFIGTPSMNFMTGRLTPHYGTLAFDTGTFRVPLPPASADVAGRYADRAVIAGVRPSAVQVLSPGGADGVKPPEAGVVAAKVDVVEPMGDVAYIFADVGGWSFTVRVDPSALPHVGQVVPLCLDGAALHLFDAETQQAIASPTRQPAATIVGSRE
jgi:hypothetical protein